MSWQYYNPNPRSNLVGDCVIRALTLACGLCWDRVYLELSSQGYLLKDMPSSNSVWGTYLRHKGFRRYIIPNECPDCYTVSDFCSDYSTGVYVLATGTGMDNYSRGWDVDYSYARGRDMRSRYTSRDDGYSRTSKEEMVNHLTDMMRSARTEEERENYRKTIDQLTR